VVVSYISLDGIIVSSDSPSKPPVQFSGSTIEYRRKWQIKREWYEKNFPGRLVTTEEGPNLSKDAQALIKSQFS
jgi:hypothetical protein